MFTFQSRIMDVKKNKNPPQQPRLCLLRKKINDRLYDYHSEDKAECNPFPLQKP